MSNNMVPSKGDPTIQVFGVAGTAASYIITHLSKFATEMVAAGVTGVILQMEHTKLAIRVIRREAQAAYPLKIRPALALNFSRVITQVEMHAELRPSIRDQTMADLEGDFKEIALKITQEILSS